MAAVIYECNECGHFWGDGPDKCPKCGSDNVFKDNQEHKDLTPLVNVLLLN